MNEKDIIQRYFTSRQQSSSVIKGIGDDAALLVPTPDHELVVTTDTMTEGTHFLNSASPYDIGHKLLAINLSDVASMGAVPRWATLNITLTEIDLDWLQDFSQGLMSYAAENNIILVGGDTTRGKTLTLSLQLIAEVPSAKAMQRHQARAGDLLFVTGEIGHAASALIKLQKNEFKYTSLEESELNALFRPQSRINLGIALRDFSHACIDISDGLLHELEIICQASELGARIQLENILTNSSIPLEQAITGGEDYELLFTARPEHKAQIQALSETYHCPISLIGEMTTSQEIALYRYEQLQPMPKQTGYEHFINK